MTDTPRIYVACLASYNSGILHGRWIDADQTADAIRKDVRAMLAASPMPDAEEWAIHDHEGFEGVRLSEWESFEKVAELAAFTLEHGELGGAVLSHFCGDLDEAREAMEDRYCGQYESLADFAEEITGETAATIPESLRPYIDYEAMARDMEMGGDVFTVETGLGAVHVFWNR